jgi:hypothetical protein
MVRIPGGFRELSSEPATAWAKRSRRLVDGLNAGTSGMQFRDVRRDISKFLANPPIQFGVSQTIFSLLV